MNSKILITGASVLAALCAPMAAHAQATSSISITGNVQKACVIGNPATLTLALGDLTGADGRLTPTLVSSAVAQSTTLNNTFCNTPSTLSVDANPLALTTPPAYASPTGFSRFLTYNATLVGWPADLTDRPLVGSGARSTPAPQARFANLVLNISTLGTLNAAGNAEASGSVLEAGSYSGSVTVSVAVQ